MAELQLAADFDTMQRANHHDKALSRESDKTDVNRCEKHNTRTDKQHSEALGIDESQDYGVIDELRRFAKRP